MTLISRKPSIQPPPSYSNPSDQAGLAPLQPEYPVYIRAKAVFAEPSAFTPEYQILLRQLRLARKESGLTQIELGERLGQPQAIISKCERGERRLDVIELRAYCTAMGIAYLDFLRQVEVLISNEVE